MLNSILGREGTPDTVGAGLGLVLDTYKDQLHRNMFYSLSSLQLQVLPAFLYCYSSSVLLTFPAPSKNVRLLIGRILAFFFRCRTTVACLEGNGRLPGNFRAFCIYLCMGHAEP